MKVSFEMTEEEMEKAVTLLSRFTGGISLPSNGPSSATAKRTPSEAPDEVGQGEVSEVLGRTNKSIVGKDVRYPATVPDFIGGPGWMLFSGLVLSWISNFDVEGPQPDRNELLRVLSEDPDHGKAFTCVSHCGSLQVAIKKVLEDAGVESCSLDFVEKVAGNIVQVSHATLPELAQYYDISSKWRRRA
jgi:hypothetical protein